MGNKIDKQKLKDYMLKTLELYPNGCASYNWLNAYSDILSGKKEICDYEIESIIDDILNEFNYGDLGLCGCGLPEYTNFVIKEILRIQSITDYNTKKDGFSSLCNVNIKENDNYHGLIQFVLYVLDNHGFLNHGSSVGGAWLTDKGKMYLDILEWYYMF